MYSQLVIAALAASVSANLLVPGHFPIRRDIHVARQTASAASASGTGLSDEDCQSSILSIAESVPTPDAALSSYEATYSPTDSCSYSVPSSLSSDYSSYSSAVYSWYSANSDAMSSIISECPQYAAETSEVSECSATATGTGSSDSSATGTASGSSETGSSSTGTSTGSSASASASGSGASAREVGIVGAVLAGILGAAVAL